MFKKAYDISKLSLEEQDYRNNNSKEALDDSSGIACGKLAEPIPKYINADCEVVLSGQNNAWIVLGRDRPGSRVSGYGGRGDTQAASVDIVVGRMGANVKKVNANNKQLFVDPDFKNDAARIHISQKTDVDKNFGLVEGKVGSPKPRSAIAMKADEVRLVSRGGIKLITRTDAKNSQGGSVSAVSGIDIIAGNDDTDIQPMVKGDNVREALERLAHHVDKLSGIVDAFMMAQTEYNTAVSTHFHYSPFFATPTTFAEGLPAKGLKTAKNLLYKVKRGIVSFKANIAGYRLTYLNPLGKKYINSRYNSVN